jgi:hypothetical protein
MAGGLAINPSYFSYNSALNQLTVLFSIDPLLIKIWSFIVTGTLIKDSHTYFTLPYQVDLNVDGGCVVTVISPGIMPPNQSYKVGTGPGSISITGWTDSYNACGAFTYTAILLNGDPLPTFITLSGNTFTMNSISDLDSNYY